MRWMRRPPRRSSATLRTRLAKNGAQLADEPDEAEAERAGPSGADQARSMHAEGTLTEEEVDDAIFRGDRAFVVHALALLAGVSDGIVEAILNAHSAKGVVAIVWKAGLGMRLAMKVQMQIAQIAPSSVVKARDGVDFPLTEGRADLATRILRGRLDAGFRRAFRGHSIPLLPLLPSGRGALHHARRP